MGLNPVVCLNWCHFEGENASVVFEETSGQTYLLDPLRALVLTFFESGMTHAEVKAEVVRQLQEFAPTGNATVLDDLFREFAALGLLEEPDL